MKILYLITKSEAGGAQTHIFQMASFLIKKGNKVAVMAKPGGFLEIILKQIGAKFYPNIFFSSFFSPFTVFSALRKIEKAVNDFKPDLVSCHSSLAGFLGRLAIKNKIPTVFTAHGWAFTEGVSFFKKFLAQRAERWVSRCCSKIICVCKHDKELALKHKIAPEEKLTVIHNGVEIPDTLLEKAFDTPLKIVFIGRFALQKNQLLFCQAFQELPDELKQKANICFIGKGPLKPQAENFVKQNNLSGYIEFLGELKRVDIFQILESSHILALISNWEGFPRAILEAMAFGLAIIATDIAGVGEAVSQDCGILVKRGDKQAIKQALEKLLLNPNLVQKMGKASRQRASRLFPLSKMLSETEKIYKELLNAPSQF